MAKSRRDNGSGSIYRRDDSTWVGKIQIGLSNGKPKYKYVSGKSEAAVKKKLKEIERSTTHIDKSVVSVGTYITGWMKSFKYGTLKPSSYDRLEKTVRNQVIPFIGSIQIQQLTAEDVQKLLSDLRHSGKSYSTVKKTYDCLNAVLAYAVENEDIRKNPMTLVKMPDRSLFSGKEIRYFTDREAAAITEEARRLFRNGKPVHRYGYAYILMLNTGLRMGELLGLRREDYSEEKKLLHVRRNVQSVRNRSTSGEPLPGRHLVETSTKTYSGNRLIPLNENSTDALQHLLENNESNHIVRTSNDGIVPPERLERSFYALLNRIGIEQTGTHSLRHTFASMLFEDGVDVKTVSTLLGHSSVQITLNTYIHLINGIKNDTTASLDQRF